MRRFSLSVTILAALAACGSQGKGNAPPGCRPVGNYLRCEEPYGGSPLCCEASGAEPYTCWDPNLVPEVPSTCTGTPFDPGNPGATDGSADSGSGGMSTTSTTGSEPWCTQDCPEEADGVCPGHASWNRGIIIWGVYRRNNEDGTPDTDAPANVNHLPPVCVSHLPICYDYNHPDEIPAKEGEMTMRQLQDCQDLAPNELAGLGVALTTDMGQHGHTLVHHFCTQGTQLNVTFQGQTFGATATGSESACLGPWEYDTFCSMSACPDSGGGDSSGGQVDSTAGTSDGALDCEPLSNSGDISVSVDRTDYFKRDVVVRGDAAEMLIAQPYDALWYCSDAQIDMGGKLFDLPRGSLLSNLGLRQGDLVKEIEGEGSPGAMMDAAANAVTQARAFTMKIYRGSTLLTYKVEVIDPNM